MNPFQSLRDYETFVYSLAEKYPAILSSTLTVIHRGRYRAELVGELRFSREVRLSVQEYISLDTERVVIEGYSYEVWHGGEKAYWYDSQPHPHIPELKITDPHHKHVPPDIKHNRIPAPGFSFTEPNLPLLVTEVERYLAS